MIGCLLPDAVFVPRRLDIEIGQAEHGEPVADDRGVVAAVEVQGVDVGEQSIADDGLDGLAQYVLERDR